MEGTPKTARGARTFALTTPASEALRARQSAQATDRAAAGDRWRDQNWVFTTMTGSGLDANNVNRAFRRIRERAGVGPLPVHSLRHATASILLGSGVPLAVAAKMMGHSVALFCETYADLLVEATRDSARQVDAFWALREGMRPRPEPPGREPRALPRHQWPAARGEEAQGARGPSRRMAAEWSAETAPNRQCYRAAPRRISAATDGPGGHYHPDWPERWAAPPARRARPRPAAACRRGPCPRRLKATPWPRPMR